MLTEVGCETDESCEYDLFFFKGIAAQWFGAAAQAAPYASESITTSLRSSAKAAAQQCTGGDKGTECGFKWTGSFDGITDVGPELNALNVVLANLAVKSTGPAKAGSTNTTLGGSAGPSVSGSAASQTAGSGLAAVRHLTAGRFSFALL